MDDVSSEEVKYIREKIPKLIGSKIRELRESKGLTQVELANRINSDRQYLYKIEKGIVGITISKLAIIAKALNVHMKDLVDI